MRILHSIDLLDMRYGGPVRAVMDLSESMSSLGHSVCVVCEKAPDAPASWRGRGANPSCHELGSVNLLKMRFKGAPLQQLKSLVGESDVVHIHGIWTPYQVQVADVARRQGVPYVFSCRGMLDDWCMEQRAIKKRVYLKIAGGQRMLNGAALVHCTAEGEFMQSKKWFPRAQGRVIPNLLDLTPYQLTPDPEPARKEFAALRTGLPHLLFLSRLHYKKGVELLIEAAKILHDNGNPHHVLIAGTGDAAYEKSLRDLVARRGLTEAVSFLGMVVGDLKVSLYAACDLFVLPTSQENFGFVLYEAMAAGTPLMTTTGVDTWPELKEAGGLIVGRNAAEFAAAIAEATADNEALRARGVRGREWVFTHLDERRIAEAFDQFYRDAVTGVRR